MLPAAPPVPKPRAVKPTFLANPRPAMFGTDLNVKLKSSEREKQNSHVFVLTRVKL